MKEEVDSMDNIEEEMVSKEEQIEYRRDEIVRYIEAKKGQVEQILNFDSNRFKDSKVLGYFFDDYVDILKLEFKSEEKFDSFKKSLEDSRFLIKQNSMEDYMEKITQLEQDNSKSFLIIPIVVIGHLFSSVVFRKDESNFEFVIINKGARPGNVFEKYTIPLSNIKNICKIYVKGMRVLNYEVSRNKIETIIELRLLQIKMEKVYSILKKNSVYIDKMENMDAKDQIVGNCYIKNVEEGFKYACYLSYEICEEQNNIIVPKFPHGTRHFHTKLLEMEANKLEKIINGDYDSTRGELSVFTYLQEIESDAIRDREEKYIKEEVSKLQMFIKDKKELYEKNKIFREFMKELEGKPYEEKKNEIFKKYNVGSFDEFKAEVMSFVDKRTFNKYICFFIDMLLENSQYIPLKIMKCKHMTDESIVNYKLIEGVIFQDDTENLEFFVHNFQDIGTKMCIKALQEARRLCFEKRGKMYQWLFWLEMLVLGVPLDQIWTDVGQMAFLDIVDECELESKLFSNDKERTQDKIIEIVKGYIKIDRSGKHDTISEVAIDFAKSGYIEDSFKIYEGLIDRNKCTIKDIEGVIFLLKQENEPVEKHKDLIEKIKSILQKKDKKFYLTRYKFINKILTKLFRRRFEACLKIKKIRFEFLDIIGEKNNALSEAGNILSLYETVGLKKTNCYLDVKYREFEILREMHEIDSAKEKLIELVSIKEIGRNGRVNEGLRLLFKEEKLVKESENNEALKKSLVSKDFSEASCSNTDNIDKINVCKNDLAQPFLEK